SVSDMARHRRLLSSVRAEMVSVVSARPRVLFFVEGFTDIRFVTGLSAICDLTMCVPERHYADSGLRDRVAASGSQIRVHEIPGSRPAFQLRSLSWLWHHARDFDVI